jgi:hypothetical protein
LGCLRRRELAGVDDAHVHARADGVVQEGRVHGLAHRVVPAEREGDVAEAARDLGQGQGRLDAPRRLQERDRVLVVLLDPVATVRMFGSKMMSWGGKPTSSVRIL